MTAGNFVKLKMRNNCFLNHCQQANYKTANKAETLPAAPSEASECAASPTHLPGTCSRRRQMPLLLSWRAPSPGARISPLRRCTVPPPQGSPTETSGDLRTCCHGGWSVCKSPQSWCSPFHCFVHTPDEEEEEEETRWSSHMNVFKVKVWYSCETEFNRACLLLT